MPETIEVHFSHPRTVTSLTADVSPQVTGEEVIEALLATDKRDSFLAPPPPGNPYQLVLRRTGVYISPDMTFEDAGVEEGDTIEIVIAAVGAGPDWTELGHMLFWSVAAASVFIKAAKPILLEFLKNKRSRSIIIRTGKSEIVLSGDDPEKVLEILKLIENRSISDALAGESGNPPQDSTIQIVLHDSEGRDSEEDQSGS